MKKLLHIQLLFSLLLGIAPMLMAQEDPESCFEDCVYPGNTTAHEQQLPTSILNTDEVNVEDVLLIGLHYGATGVARIDGNTHFSAQTATNWQETATSPYEAVDLKHVDCNGDGVIDVADLQVIIDNYGKILPTAECGDTNWISDIRNGISPWSEEACRNALVQYDFNGTAVYYLNSLCSDTDLPAIFFNCAGEPICYINGFAAPYCAPDFVEQLTFVQSIWQGSNCVCFTDYDPVCGLDGNTYSNRCHAVCTGILIASPGRCDCACPDIYDPVCGSNGIDYHNSCLAECASVSWTTGSCQGCDCPAIYEPVCGVDGVTYSNFCEADCIGMPWTEGACGIGHCHFTDTGITAPEDCHKVERFLYQGNTVFLVAPCQGAQIADGLTLVYDCSGSIICREGGISGATECSTLNFWQQATIQAIEVSCFDNCNQCFCPEYYSPICAEDGETYGNPCLAECAGVIGRAGACDDCQCMEIYDPVCGANGITYSNSCHASCAGTAWTPGSCGAGTSPIQQIHIEPHPISACVEDTAILWIHTHWPSSDCQVQSISIDRIENDTEIYLIYESGPADFPCDEEQHIPLTGFSPGQQHLLVHVEEQSTGQVWVEALTFSVHECVANCPCPEMDDPVCGSDGQTYDNACFAECVGVTWRAGACHSPPLPSPIILADIHPSTDCVADTTSLFVHTNWPSSECKASNITTTFSNIPNQSVTAITLSADYAPGPMDEPCDDIQDIIVGHLSAGQYELTFIANDVTTGESWTFDVSFTVEPCANQCDCPAIYEPVCGTNGVTYSNSCAANCAQVDWTPGACNEEACRFEDTGAPTEECHKVERYRYQGQTVFVVSPCQGSHIADGLTVVYDCMGQTICQEGGFVGFTECSDADFWNQATFEELVLSCAHHCPNCACDDFHDPVCGSDGVTYSNSCHAECAGVTWSVGGCEEPSQNCPCPLAFVPVCGPDNRTYDNACLAECSKLMEWTSGVCQNEQSYHNNIKELLISNNTYCDSTLLSVRTEWWSGSCSPESYEIQRVGQNIMVQVNYNIGVASFICTDDITVNIGLLSPGFYKVYFNATDIGSGKTSVKTTDLIIGRCTAEDCACIDTDPPVCGSNGVNYACEEEALCHGITNWTSGFCDCTYPYTGTVTAGFCTTITLDNHIVLEPYSLPDEFDLTVGQRVQLNAELKVGFASTCQSGYIVEVWCIEEIPQKGLITPFIPTSSPNNQTQQAATANLKTALIGEELLPNGDILYNFDLLLEGNEAGSLVDAVYGLAFSIHYTSDLPTVAEALFNDEQGQSYSWVGDAQSTAPNEQLLTLAKVFTHENGGRIEVALSRINHQTVSGTGRICRVSCVATIDHWTFLTENADASLASTITSNSSISLNDVRLIDSNNNSIPTNGGQSNMDIALPLPTLVQVRAFLEGAFSTEQNPNQPLNNTLSVTNLLSIQQPYHESPWNYNAPLPTADAITAEGFGQVPTDMVDWVSVEVRAADHPAQIIEQKVGLLRTDGHLMDVASLSNNLGNTGLLFYNLAPETDYYIVLRHRNHLDVMSATPVTWEGNRLVYDFTTAAAQALGNEQLKEMAPNQFALYAGDFDGNGIISVSDFNQYTQQISNANVYQTGDLDFDGNVFIQDFNLYQPNASAIGVHWIRY